MSNSPHWDSPERAERRRDVVFVAGLLIAAVGVWVLVQGVFNPTEYCNAFRCTKEYKTADIMGGLVVVALGAAMVWANRRRT